MRDFPIEVRNKLSDRQGIIPRVLWWVKARNRSTGDIEQIGFWNGDDHQTFVIDGQSRLYYGAGNILGFGQQTLEAALHIRTLTVSTTAISPEVQLALRGYQTRYAPTEIHLAIFDTDTNNLVAPPVRMFKGWINKLKIKTPKVNGQGNASIELVGHTRLLTKMLAAKRSDQNQKLRNPSDTFFRDVAMTGTVITPWGEKGVAARGGGGGDGWISNTNDTLAMR